MKILVVDDDPGCRDLLASHLNRTHDLSLLSDGSEALALLENEDHGFDLVLLDLQMPRLGGDKLVLALHEKRGNLKLRFIIMSGRPDLDHVDGLPNVFAVLRKPFKLASLDSLLNSAGNVA